MTRGARHKQGCAGGDAQRRPLHTPILSNHSRVIATSCNCEHREAGSEEATSDRKIARNIHLRGSNLGQVKRLQKASGGSNLKQVKRLLDASARSNPRIHPTASPPTPQSFLWPREGLPHDQGRRALRWWFCVRKRIGNRC